VPRNIDPAASQVENVFCYDIDDLGAVVDASLHERRRAAGLAERIVDQEVSSVASRLQSLDIAPVVVHMQGRIEEICRTELERFLHKSGTQDARTVRELEAMVARIAGKVTHPWIVQMRSNNKDPAQRDAFLAAVRKMFGLSDPDE